MIEWRARQQSSPQSGDRGFESRFLQRRVLCEPQLALLRAEPARSERAYKPPAEPPPLDHDTWGAPHPKAAAAGPPARTAGFDLSPLLSFAFGTALPAPHLPFPNTPGSVQVCGKQTSKGGKNKRMLHRRNSFDAYLSCWISIAAREKLRHRMR